MVDKNQGLVNEIKQGLSDEDKIRPLINWVKETVRLLVDDPSLAKIECLVSESVLVITVKSASTKTLSYLIGKKGNTISAVRHIVRCAGARFGVKVVYEVAGVK